MTDDRTSRSVAAKKLDDLGLGEEKKKVEPVSRGYGGGYGRRSSFGGGLFDDLDDGGYEPPAFLRRDSSTQSSYTPPRSYAEAKGKGASVVGDADPSRKHTGERTAQYAPHSYIESAEKFKVGDSMMLPEAAVFSPEAAKFVAKRAHEAMADALEAYGLIWSSKASLAAKDMIRATIEDCFYKKPDASGNTSMVAVRVKESEV